MEALAKFLGELAALALLVLAILFLTDLIGFTHVFSERKNVDTEEVGKEDRIRDIEKRVQRPTTFDWNAHNKLRHEYITSIPPNLRKAMEQADIILEHSIMDRYILNTLSDWEIDINPSKARTNLLMKSQPFPDLHALNAACFMAIGDLYAMEGKRKEAIDSYLKVEQDSFMPSQYRILAQQKLNRLKQRS